MITSVMFLFVTALLVFSYHYERNGNPWNLGDFGCRCLWVLSVVIGYTALHYDNIHPLAVIWMGASAFLQLMVPHAFAQNMGNRTQTWEQMPRITLVGSITLPKWWPGALFIWVKNFAIQDFLGMASVGFWRGLVVFGPPMALGFSAVYCAAAIAITTIWQPVSYWVGYRIPYSIWTNAANSSTWGEFGIGIGWSIALLISR